MHTPIVLLSMGLAVAVASGALADHAALISSRNLAAARADRAAAAFIESCSSQRCDVDVFSTGHPIGTALAGCVRTTGTGAALSVEAQVDWEPKVFVGLDPAKGGVVRELGAFSEAASQALNACQEQ